MILISTPLTAQILLNEFMIDPENDNTGEFIEIYNAGDTLVDLRDFFLCDAQDTDAVIAFPDSLLLPRQYGLILDPDYTGEYDDLIPDNIPTFTIPDSRFGMYGISNSTSKPFSLLNSHGSIQDSYITGTPVWPHACFTIERNSFSNNDWNVSLSEGGTPGFKNSTAIKDHELYISDLRCAFQDTTLNIFLTIKNSGLLNLTKISYGYIVDIFTDTFSLSDTLLFTYNNTLRSGDSVLIELDYDPAFKGRAGLTSFAGFNENAHDTLSSDIFIRIEENEILVTEFVAKTGERFTSEYIEIYNMSDHPLSLKGLEIHDLSGKTVVDSNYVLCPDSLLVLAQSASFHDDFPFVDNYLIIPAWRGLNNSEDLIAIFNPSSSLVFELDYNSEWDIANDCAMLLIDTSLDHQNPNNWEISYDGSPGTFNTTHQQLQHLSAYFKKNFFTPKDTLQFQIVNDGFFPHEETQCVFSTPVKQQLINIPRSVPGDTISCVIDTAGVFSEGTNSCTLAMESTHIFPLETKTIKFYLPYSVSPIFFNEVLFDPIDTYGQVEFIELECSKKPFDLDHWKIRVNNSRFEMGDSLTNTYTAICDIDDNVEGLPSGAKKMFSTFPSLPNAGAELFLLDPMDSIIDFVDLRDHPEIRKGKSLEKQFRAIRSNDPGLWFASVSSWAMTPGTMNSITSLPAQRCDLDIYPDIFDPASGDLLQFSIDSKQGVDFCELLIFNLAGQCIYKHDQNTFSNPSLLHFWDGRLENGEFPIRGLYLTLVIAHQIDGETLTLRETFVIK